MKTTTILKIVASLLCLSVVGAGFYVFNALHPQDDQLNLPAGLELGIQTERPAPTEVPEPTPTTAVIESSVRTGKQPTVTVLQSSPTPPPTTPQQIQIVITIAPQPTLPQPTNTPTPIPTGVQSLETKCSNYAGQGAEEYRNKFIAGTDRMIKEGFAANNACGVAVTNWANENAQGLDNRINYYRFFLYQRCFETAGNFTFSFDTVVEEYIQNGYARCPAQ